MAHVDADPSLRPSGLAIVRLPKVQRITSYQPTEGSIYSSPIRKLLAVASQPGVDSVAGGLPLTTTLERILQEFGPRVAKHMMAETAGENNYGGTAGEERARKTGANILRDRGIDVDWQRVYISPAATPAIAALAEAALPYGKGIAIVDAPAYPGGIAGLWKRRPEFKQIRMDKRGPLPQDLEAAFQDALENPDKPNVVWYTTLTGNTFGITATDERRKAYTDIIAKYAAPDMLGNRLVVIEDDPYLDINMSGDTAPRPLTSYLLERGLDENVSYIQTLSKSLTPASRMGFVVPAPHLADNYVSAAESIFMFNNRPNQLAVADLYEEGVYQSHTARLGEDYAPNRDVMEQALAQHADEANWTWTAPEFGFFFGVHVQPEDGEMPQDMEELFTPILEKKGAAYVPGKKLYIAEDPTGEQAATMRMALSYPPDQIERAVDKIAQGIAESRRGRKNE